MAEWPQAGGPDGSWTTKERAPHRWSVAENRNILFKTELPETGQSGIAKFGDRLYFTTMEPLRNARARKDGGNIVGHAADASTGEIRMILPNTIDITQTRFTTADYEQP